jgi:glycosyltransferase involved in cell wall biosynthesis
MRITLFGPAPPLRGGIVTYLAMLARVLEARGHELAWVSFRAQYPRFLFPGSAQEGEIAPWLRHESEATFVPWNPLSWRRTAAAIARTRPDAVVLKYWIPFFAPGYHGVLRAVRRRRPQARIVTILDNVVPHERYPFGRALTRAALGQSHAFVAQSAQVRRDLDVVLPGVDPARVVTSPHPVYDFSAPGRPRPSRAEARARLGLPADAHVALFFGFIKPYKGVHHLIDALPALEQRFGDAIRVVIVGDVYGDEREYRDHVARTGAAGICDLRTGFVADEEIESYFVAADLVVLPYVSATQSGIVQIAYNYDRPVVTTAVGGLPEVVRPGETGFLVPPEDPPALARAIERFFVEDWAERLAAGVRREKVRYSWDALAEAVEELARPGADDGGSSPHPHARPERGAPAAEPDR